MVMALRRLSGLTDGECTNDTAKTEPARSRLHRERCDATLLLFDIRNGQDLYPDEEGLELADQRAAEIEAAMSLAGLAKDLPPLDERQHMAIEVRTLDGPIFRAAFIFEMTRLKH